MNHFNKSTLRNKIIHKALQEKNCTKYLILPEMDKLPIDGGITALKDSFEQGCP